MQRIFACSAQKTSGTGIANTSPKYFSLASRRRKDADFEEPAIEDVL
jgi:hypothetical protein